MKPKMFLYWNILCFAAERVYRQFDFGRSFIDSGTHRFKKGWGSQEVPLYWAYWVPDSAPLPETNKENRRYRSAYGSGKNCPWGRSSLVLRLSDAFLDELNQARRSELRRLRRR